ncbi:MAG: carbon-nitrogen hydrolase family protein [Nitrospinae bacterium]|nr:carbon-nitrogen hydrolase family protein [Nitrospinota bacterium]
MKKVKTGLIQVSSNENFEENMDKAEKYIRKAVEAGAQIIALPENVCQTGKVGAALKFVNDCKHVVALERFKTIAAAHNIYLIAGSIPFPVPNDDSKVYNTSVLIDNTGKVLHEYNKIHLFDVAVNKETTHHESDFIKAGNRNGLQVINLPFAKVGILICFDLRFPEVFRELMMKGVEILFIPAAFTHYTGNYHWETLLRARAVDNQFFVVAPNQTGEHFPGRRSWGHSMIINPWGTILNSLEVEEGFLVQELNIDEMYDIRSRLPLKR